MALIMKLVLAIFLSSFLQLTLTAAVSLPAPSGNYSVGTLELQLTDYSRSNPFGDPISPGPRKFMISIFYPSRKTAGYPLASYVPSATGSYFERYLGLPNGTLSRIQPNSYRGAPISSCGEAQVILFSPGYAASRYFYTVLAEDLASHGYLVVTLDHTYDAPIVEFPDGTIVMSDPATNISDPSILAQLLDLRVKDTLYTLESLHGNVTRSIPGVHKRLRIQETGMFGHSLGGATTAQAMLESRRIQGGLDMDGSLQGSVVEKGLERPLLIMGTQTHNLTSDDTWITAWGNLRGWKRALMLVGAEHLTYCDFPAIAELLGLRDILPPAVLEGYIGTLNGLRAIEIQRVYIRAFFDFIMCRKGDTFLNGSDPRYPEIVFQN